MDPRQLSAEQALALLLVDPLLIRRPLIQWDAAHLLGFDLAALNALLPAQQQLQAAAGGSDGCSREAHGHVACQPPQGN
ncbi:hypothetical protein D3C71_2058010 [compost metagenome]